MTALTGLELDGIQCYTDSVYFAAVCIAEILYPANPAARYLKTLLYAKYNY